MQIDTIQMDPRIARIHYLDYLKKCREHRELRQKQNDAEVLEAGRALRKARTTKSLMEREDENLMKAYRELYRGKQLIDVRKTINDAGYFEDTYLPRLAICRADATACKLEIRGTHAYMFDNNKSYYQRGLDKFIIDNGEAFLFAEVERNQRELPTRATALVPSVPVHLRPSDLSKYHILWEAEWEAKAPIDPILLSKVTEKLYVVVAKWDLTPLEQRVLEDRLRSH